MARALENEVQKQIKDFLRSKNILCERIQSGFLKTWRSFIHLATSGHPDLVCYLRWWRTLFIEVKRPGWKVSPDQLAYHEKLTLLWFDIIVADNLSVVEEKIYSLGYT